jgi:hypothetical protein
MSEMAAISGGDRRNFGPSASQTARALSRKKGCRSLELGPHFFAEATPACFQFSSHIFLLIEFRASLLDLVWGELRDVAIVKLPGLGRRSKPAVTGRWSSGRWLSEIKTESLRHSVSWATRPIAEREVREQKGWYADIFDNVLGTAHYDVEILFSSSVGAAKADALVADGQLGTGIAASTPSALHRATISGQSTSSVISPRCFNETKN